MKPYKYWDPRTCNCECKFIKCCNTAAGYFWDPWLCKCVKKHQWWPIDFPAELAKIQEEVEEEDYEGTVACPEFRTAEPLPMTSTPATTTEATTTETTSDVPLTTQNLGEIHKVLSLLLISF